MNPSVDGLSLFLFVPADQPARFQKAVSAGADAAIIDLEDAVAPPGKCAAREGLRAALPSLSAAVPVFIRINAVATPWHTDDLTAVATLDIAGIVLPKAESARQVETVRAQAQAEALIAIVESARGLAAVEEIASAADLLAFGSIDFAADLGFAHSREALLMARSRIVLASRLAGRPAPTDGVTQAIHNIPEIEADARYGASLGFGGKLLIHPAQIAPARRGMAPAQPDIEWATRVVAAMAEGSAIALDGAMVDAPVLARAVQILKARDRFLIG